jgi:hypothetical protein
MRTLRPSRTSTSFWFAGVVALACSTAAPALAQQSPCPSVAAGTYWYRLQQSNGAHVTIRFQVSGAKDVNQRPRHTVSGDVWLNKQPQGPNYIRPDGNVSGRIVPRGAMDVTVNWHNGSVGRYTARSFVANRFVRFSNGLTVDQRNTNSRARWSSTNSLPCA